MAAARVIRGHLSFRRRTVATRRRACLASRRRRGQARGTDTRIKRTDRPTTPRPRAVTAARASRRRLVRGTVRRTTRRGHRVASRRGQPTRAIRPAPARRPGRAVAFHSPAQPPRRRRPIRRVATATCTPMVPGQMHVVTGRMVLDRDTETAITEGVTAMAGHRARIVRSFRGCDRSRASLRGSITTIAAIACGPCTRSRWPSGNCRTDR